MTEILVVELLGGFGDLLLALPVVHALARSQPDARVHVATFSPGGELLARDPLVASVTTTSDHGEGAPRRFVEQVLTSRRFDLAVTTTTYDGIGALLASQVPRVVTDLWRGPSPGELVDERFLRLLASDGLVRPELVREPPRVALDPVEVAGGHALLGERAPVLLLPDAGMAVKRWPYWRGLADALTAGRPPAEVLAVRGPDPAAAQATGARVLPVLTLPALAGLAAAVGERGGVAVGADTGPLRLAAAAGARTLGLYGPTLASRYGQRPEDGNHALQGLSDCQVRRPTAITEQECWWSARCPLTGDGPACMADIAPESVLRTVRAMLRDR